MFRKILKISGIVLAALILVMFFVVLGFWISTSDYKLEDEKLKLNYEMTAFYDDAGNTIERNASEAFKISELKKETLNAFIAVEDRKFYEHKGVNFKRILGAALKNVATFSFQEGGSTISQQLIKNTHLSNEKTFRRKFAELRLTRELEKRYTKDQILELYLNSIYFGKCGYGIANAAKGFYGKTPEKLTLAESASLAGVIKSPSIYSPYLHYDKFLARRNLVLKLMLEQEMIGKSEYDRAVSETPSICDKPQQNANLAYLNGALDECASVLNIPDSQINNRNLRIYTYLNANQQKLLESVSKSRIQSAMYCANTDDSIVILDNERAAVTALYSTNYFAAERKRQPASAIKPLLVYGPALENGLIEPATLLEDKKESIAGFTPSNYHDKYYGTVSARFALANSLNVPAVRLLNDLSVDRAMRYLEKNGMTVDDGSRHLASALGGFTEGMTLLELCNGYRTLASEGVYCKTRFIRKIENAEGKVLYDAERAHANGRDERRVFSEQTSFLLNDMLADCVKNGTAKNLRTLPIPLCAKTGTNGNEKGNRDAYTISYNRAYTVGCWIGADTPFDNSITGSTLPCLAARDVWAELSKKADASDWGFTPPAGVTRQSIDGETLKKDRRFELADENAPEGSVITDYFRHEITAKSEKYSHPTTRDFKVERKEDILSVSFFGEKKFSYRVYDDCCGEKTLLLECEGKDETVNLTTEPLHSRHKIAIVAVYREKNIEGEPQSSDEFVFSCNFVPDTETPEAPEPPPADPEPETPAPPEEETPSPPDDKKTPPDSEEPDSDDVWWW